MNTASQKNELIFEYSSGNLGAAKSLFISTYLFLNTVAAKKAVIFDNILGGNLNNLEEIKLEKLKYSDCTKNNVVESKTLIKKNNNLNPISNLVGDLNTLSWKSIFKGFREYNLPVEDVDIIKLIKMDPGTSVPLHSHNGKEYILVLEGSFCDEFGEYNKGEMQINDHKVKHHPTACGNTGCICLSISEKEVVFFGKYGSALNLFTFIKSFFK